MPLEKPKAADRPPTERMIFCLLRMREGFTLFHNARGSGLFKKTGPGRYDETTYDVATQTLYGLHERGMIETDWEDMKQRMDEDPFYSSRVYKATQKGLDALPP